nr:MAG TPA: DUP family [Caudoviricetes sp.]
MIRNNECECYESRKNYRNGIWLNPKYFYNGQSAGKILSCVKQYE